MRDVDARRRLRIPLTIILAAALCAPVVPAIATPSTPEIDARRAEAAEARTALDQMNVELEERIEEYNAIAEALDGTRERIREARADLDCAEVDLQDARATLGRRAANIYKDGGSGVLDVFLGARSFQEFLVRMDLAVRINRSDAETVAAVKEAKARVEALAAALEQREAEQIALKGEAEARARDIEADITAQERYVASLDQAVRQLIAEEEERQRLLAEERARAAAERAASTPASGGRPADDVAQLGSGHPEVVGIALQYLGVPYVWGGSSPAGFDCSGLTSYCYRQIGISLPRTSASQYRVGRHIAPDRVDLLVPGDLVFFGRNGDPDRVHHVGIYVGDGNYVHAPQTGDVVKVSSLTERISSRGDYVGASRL